MTKCASAAFVLALLVLSAGAQELLRDDFTHGLAKWLVADPALVRAADGGLRILPGGALAAGDATWRDYRVSFRARTVEQPRGDGHWGIHLRAVPGPPEGELYVFARPERIALAGSGKTEWGFTEAPPFDSTQEHLYQLTVADGQVEVAVDGRVLGVAHNIGNATGGVRLSAYNCAVEIRDVVIDALTPEAAPAEPAQPVDLAPGDLALDPAGLPDYVDVVVCNPTGVRRANEPVVLDLTTVSFPSTPNLSSLTATDAATCAALPTQVDDLLGTGRIPAKGTPEALYGPRLCVLVSLAPYAARTIRLRYATASGDYRRTASTGFATRLDGGSLTVTTAVYTARFNAKGGFTFQPAGFDRPFITTRDPDEETLICRRVGPVGAFLMSRYPVKDNGRVTRVIEAWPDRAKVTTVLAPADNRHDAFVGPVGGFWFDIPMDAVNELRYHTVDGFDEETPGAARPVERLYAAPNSPGLDFVLANTSVALVRRQRPDYTPGMGVIGWHHYASGGLAFGWRPPVQVTRDRPHVQELWLVPHPGEMDAFGEVDLACRRPVEVVVNAGRPPVGARYPRPSGGRPEGNAEAAARPTPLDYHDRARRRAAEMGDLEAAANLPGHTKLLFEAVRGARARFAAAAGVNGKLDDYLAGEALLGKLDLPAAARRIASTLGAASGAPARDHEVAPWRALVGQARTCAAAAAWDLAADHEPRGAQRLARAADLYARAKRYAARAPSRIAPAVPAGGLYPYVTFSEGAHAKLARVGFDVGHFWVPWGNHFEQLEVEPRPGQWDFSTTDQLFADAANSRMATIPLLNFAPPRWWQKQFEPARDAANAPPGSTGDARLVSPKLLGRVPPPKQAFGEYIRQMAGRYGKQPGLLAWSVRNEPAYYETGGINGPLMREAFDHWIGERYPTVAALNAVWGTEFADFGGLVPPRKWEDNRAAWYDLMSFKAECLNGEL
ncbi:MAG: beta-galactosidase, partial [Armatimonadetes bacterium]|nr:beta-galactosidase [Armatimonadota bacterium]